MSDVVDYRKFVYSAMCNVIREAMCFFSNTLRAKDVHVAISFLTNSNGVVLPDYLKVQYPESMTIVLQYQFRELSVGDDSFSVILSFRGREERITVPFSSITKYVDILANFSLDLEQYGDIELTCLDHSDNDDNIADTDVNKERRTEGNIIFIDRFRKNNSPSSR